MSPAQYLQQSRHAAPTPHASQLEGVTLLLSIGLRHAHHSHLDNLSARYVHQQAYTRLQLILQQPDFCPREWPDYPLILSTLDSYLTWEAGEVVVTQTYASKGVIKAAELGQIRMAVTSAYAGACENTNVSARVQGTKLRTVTRSRDTLRVSVI
jgi:hypothetical protein